MQWQEIEKAMHTLERPLGGFTNAHRGIVTMPDGTKVFVKVGVDDNTKLWAQKEVAVYAFLRTHSFPDIPVLLAYSPDHSGFALEALTIDNGWDWTDTWSEDRLASTLRSMDTLAAIAPPTPKEDFLGVKSITSDTEGWKVIAASQEKQCTLHDKLQAKGHGELASTIDIPSLATQSAKYTFKDNVLVHHDVRADNCAWCVEEQSVKLVDWSWAQLGDRDIDINATLVHVHKAGLDVLRHHLHRLRPDALQWLAGFWLNAATNPQWSGSSEKTYLRDYQLESGVTALYLRDMARAQGLSG